MLLNNHADDFRRIYVAYQRSVSGFLYGICGDADLVEDVLQETFVLVLRHRDRFDPKKGSMRNWIFSIAHNCLRTELRRSNRVREIADIGILNDFAAEGLSPEEEYTDDAMRSDILRTIDELPEPERSILLACKIEGLTLAETSARLRIANRTVSRKLFSALEKLREIMLQKDMHPAE